MCDSKIWFMDGQHLKSFWSYHQAALRWFKVHRAAREYAVNGSSEAISSSVDRKMNVIDEQFVTNNHFPVRNNCNECLSDVGLESSSRVVEEDNDMSTEMAAFFRQTIEHRKQRDADRSKEAKRYKKDGCIEDDDYVLANKIGVYGIEKRSFQLPDGPAERRKKLDEMKELYGADAEKILAMETHLDLRFEQNYSQPSAHLWPNIPLKL